MIMYMRNTQRGMYIGHGGAGWFLFFFYFFFFFFGWEV